MYDPYEQYAAKETTRATALLIVRDTSLHRVVFCVCVSFTDSARRPCPYEAS